MQKERTSVVEYGLKMLASGLTTGTGGNLSVLNRSESLLAVSPSGVEYGLLSPEDIVLVGLDGKRVEGELAPSSELAIHLALYGKRSDISAVVHTHSIYATTLACLHWEIPAVHYLVGFSGDKVPLAPYAPFGTPGLAKAVSEAIASYNAVLMANHGLIAVGKDLASAFTVAEEIEFVARIYYQARCAGEPVILSNQEMKTVVDRFAVYGQRKACEH
jgi:L-fuculose-phosphate aldolase